MSPLTEVRKLIRRSVRRQRIRNLVNADTELSHSDVFYIMLAVDLVTKVYRGKKRKNGEARICHEREMFVIAFVYLGISDVSILTAIFLHDLHEDYPKEWPLHKIEELFGRDIRNIVAAVSKPSTRNMSLVSLEFSEVAITKVKKGGVKAEILKVIDRFHNFLKPFEYKDRLKLVWKVAQTIDHIQPMSRRVGILVSELELVTANLIWKNNIQTDEFKMLT